jgi:peptidyl-prolyl cis-trans isomerase SurA
MGIFPPRRAARFGITCGAVAIAAILLAAQSATAQVALLVNGDPITNYDIEQRSRLIQISTRKQPSRQQTIDELINDKLKIQVGKRYGVVVSDTDVDNAFANIARSSGTTPENFAKSLQAGGLNPNTLKAKLRADITWGQIVRGKFASRLQVGEKDIFEALEKKSDGKDVGHEYLLRPIVLVVPRGSPASVVESRKREADALRARFQDCATGVPFARALRDVAVRDPIRRNSADLSPQLREILSKIELGRLTPPEVTNSGIEMFAVCERKETASETPSKRQIRDEMFSERFQTQGNNYLKELRAGAMIEYR